MKGEATSECFPWQASDQARNLFNEFVGLVPRIKNNLEHRRGKHERYQ